MNNTAATPPRQTANPNGWSSTATTTSAATKNTDAFNGLVSFGSSSSSQQQKTLAGMSSMQPNMSPMGMMNTSSVPTIQPTRNATLGMPNLSTATASSSSSPFSFPNSGAFTTTSSGTPPLSSTASRQPFSSPASTQPKQSVDPFAGIAGISGGPKPATTTVPINRSVSPALSSSSTTSVSGRDQFADILGGMASISVNNAKPSLSELKQGVPMGKTGGGTSANNNKDLWNFDMLASSSSTNASPSQPEQQKQPAKPIPLQPQPVPIISKPAADPFDLSFFESSKPVPVPTPAQSTPVIPQTTARPQPIPIVDNLLGDDHPIPTTFTQAPSQPPVPTSIQASPPPPPPKREPTTDYKIAQIVQMGFSITSAQDALEMTNGDMNKAIEILTEHQRAQEDMDYKLASQLQENEGRGEFDVEYAYGRDEAGAKKWEDDTSSSANGNNNRTQHAFAKASTLFAMGKAKLKTAVEKAAQSDIVKKANEAIRNIQDNSANGGNSNTGRPSNNNSGGRSYYEEYGSGFDSPSSGTSANQNQFQFSKFSDEPIPSPSTNQQSPVLPPRPTISTPPPPPKPTRPIITATDSQLSEAESHKERGNEFFKQGQFGDAEQFYSQAITALPSGHLNLIALYNNRAAARLKTGDYRGVIDDVNQVQELEVGELKSLLRRATAYENMEKWDLAQDDYRVIMAKDPNVKGVSLGLSRCAKALKMKDAPMEDGVKVSNGNGNVNANAFDGFGANTSTSTTDNIGLNMFDPTFTSKPVTSTTNATNDLASMFGSAPTTVSSSSVPSTNTTKVDVNNSEAVANVRAQDRKQEQEQAEALIIKDQIDLRINNWRGGKETNLRALISSLDSILWPELGWQSINLADLIEPNKVKVRYMKAIAKLHPDKLNKDESLEHRLLAAAIFSSLNKAWDAFKLANNL